MTPQEAMRWLLFLVVAAVFILAIVYGVHHIH